MDGDAKFLLGLFVTIAGFVALVYVMRSKLGDVIDNVKMLLVSAQSAAIQLAEIRKNGERVDLDLERLEGRVVRLEGDLSLLRDKIARLRKSEPGFDRTASSEDP